MVTERQSLHAGLANNKASACTWQGPQKRQLQALWEPSGEALNIQFWCVSPLRLQKDLRMTRPVHQVQG